MAGSVHAQGVEVRYFASDDTLLNIGSYAFEGGRRLSGLLDPLRTATTEMPLDGRGNRLAQDVHGIDAEGIVRLSDGTFWVGDENGPSIAHFAADGWMIARHSSAAPASNGAEGAVQPQRRQRIAPKISSSSPSYIA